MSGQQDNSAPASSSVTHEEVTVLEVDAVDISYDDRFLYAACKDKYVRVWSKGDWQLVAELGETNSEPLAVHVDKNHVCTTCERRVYMWRKGTWELLGWFELSYHALTSALHGDCFYIGTREGRLLSIKRDTNETSSWPLHKSEITVLWSNGSVICSGTKKEAPVVWTRDPNTAPIKVIVLDKRNRCTAITGNSQFVMVGLTAGDVKLWDRVGWNHVRTLESQTDAPLVSMWANDLYLVTSSTAGFLTIWDLMKDVQLGHIRKNGVKYGRVAADHDLIYVASSEGLVVVGISLEGQALDLCEADNQIQDESPPVVEEVLEPAEVVPTAALREIPEEGVHVLRGCAAVGGRFEYKVKVRNDTPSVITNATVTILSYPDDCMEISGLAVKTIKRIGPAEFRSPQFTFIPTKDCVEGRILTTVSYIDHQDKPHTLQVKPYKIRSVCDLLEPLESTMQQFELIIGDMEHTSERHVLDWNPDILFSKAKAFLPSRNFHIVEASGNTIRGVFTGTIRGLAEGKYTGKKVAVRMLISGPAEGNKATVVVEGLGEDIAMLPTTIDEIARGIESWTCINCGAALELDEVSQIKAGAPVRCRYCEHTMTIDLYRR